MVIRRSGLALLLSLALSGCSRHEMPSPKEQEQLTFAQDIVPGHEEITRFGIDFAKSRICSKYGSPAFPLESVPPMQSAGLYRNPILRGNLATDRPQVVHEVDLRAFYGVPGISGFDTHPRLLHLHFLRNYGNGGVATARQTCLDARQAILRATQEGLRFINSDMYRAEFFFGHAIHTIQDSFSTAHSVRVNDFHTPLDACTWDLNLPGVCRHKNGIGLEIDHRDLVWQAIPLCRLRRTFDCLKYEAQAAALATAGYLEFVDQLVRDGGAKNPASINMTSYFEDARPFGSGYLSCDQLF